MQKRRGGARNVLISQDQASGWMKMLAGVAVCLTALGWQGCAPRSSVARPGWPADVTRVLDKAGDNRGELQAVLQHYRDRGDSLGLRAAEFLIANMEEQGFTRFALFDTTGTEVALDILAYPNYDALLSAVDSLEAWHGKLDFDRKEQRDDVQAITASFLIEQIDLALRAWQEKPWAQHLTFDQFCAYVLPYRGSGEALEAWRPFFLARYAGLEQRMEDPSDPVEAARLINDDLRHWFRFDPRYYLHPTDQGLSEMVTNRMGRCEDMTNLTIYAMRANGLGVTSDYTPYWADAGNNHAWNAILDRDGKVVMFMGAEAQPGEYRLSNRVAKVYRKMYALQPLNLAFQKPAWEKVPGWLGGKSYLDVTRDYTPVTDVDVKLLRAVPDSVNFAYLCVFNDGEWRAVHWAAIDSGTVRFTDMGRGIAYLPAYYVHEEIRPAGPPFILSEDGSVIRIIPDVDGPISFPIASTTRRQELSSTDGISKVFLEAGREYELFYWDDSWVSLGTQIAGDAPLRFHGVPGDALYWLVAKDSRRDERIFTVAEGRQVFW